MEENQFKESVNRLKKTHKLISLSLIVTTICFICAPISDFFAEEGIPYEYKSILMVFTIGNIPLLYWLYEKNVIEQEQSKEEREENFLKWSAIRLYTWTTNVLLCLLLFHFDSEGLTTKINSSFYLTLFCLAVAIVLGRIKEEDLENKKDE